MIRQTRARCALMAGVFCAGLASRAVLASGISTADQVNHYTPGDFSLSGTSTAFQDPSAALGPLVGDTGFGGLTPFNPPFASNHIVGVGAGGSLTLRLSEAVPATGRTLGVFANNGLIDVSGDGSGQAATPPGTFSAPPRAIVSVSHDGTSFVPLNGGAPITFDNPTNYYLDQPIVNYFQNLGAQPAFQQKPFLGTLAGLGGQTYGQIKTTLNDSAGGTWLDTSTAGLPAVNYVRFDQPPGTTDRLILDAVVGMTAAAPIVAGRSVVFESVGSGGSTSHIVVDFGPQSFQFDVHYDGSITGLEALELIEDSSIFRLETQSFSFGELVSGMDYGGFKFAGIGSGGDDFWSYYVGHGASWSFSGQGASDRVLSHGSYDGWVWAAAQGGAPDFPIAIPEPAGAAALACGGLFLRRRRR